MATIEKRGERYSVRARTPDGRQIRKTFRRKSDARAFADAWEVDKRQGTWIDPSRGRVTFKDYVDEWIGGMSHLRPATMEKVHGHLRVHIVPAFGEMRIGSIRPDQVRGWVGELSSRGLAPSTLAGIYRTLSQIMSTAETDRVIPRTPCLGIRLPKAHQGREMRFLDAEQVSRLAEAIEERYGALIYLAAYSGARWSELAGLHRDRVNILRGRIEISETLSEVSGYLYSQGTKTGRARSITLPLPVTQILAEHLERYPSFWGWVFSTPQEGRLRRSNFYPRVFKPAVKAAGLDPALRFHDLRHTHVALLIAQGAHVKEIADRLGHLSPMVTMSTYAHVLPSLEERLSESLASTFERASKGEPNDSGDGGV